MKTKLTHNKGWLGTLDGSPFDETFHDLENIVDSADGGRITGQDRSRPTFWAA